MSAFDNNDGISADVDFLVAEGEKRQADRKLSPSQRKEKKRQAARVRLFADVPPWLKAEVMHLSKRESVSASSIAAYLISEGLRAYQEGGLDLPKIHCESPRFEWLVDVPEDKPDFKRKG